MPIEVYGDGEQVSDMLYVEDLARVLVKALELAAAGVVHPHAIEAGPVVPMQPPTTFEQMTKKRSVSKGNPGPTSTSHQPGFPVTGCTLAAYWSPVSA